MLNLWAFVRLTPTCSGSTTLLLLPGLVETKTLIYPSHTVALTVTRSHIFSLNIIIVYICLHHMGMLWEGGGQSSMPHCLLFIFLNNCLLHLLHTWRVCCLEPESVQCWVWIWIDRLYIFISQILVIKDKMKQSLSQPFALLLPSSSCQSIWVKFSVWVCVRACVCLCVCVCSFVSFCVYTERQDNS